MNYTDKQIALADALNELVIRYGAFESGDDANGCDYRDGEQNANHGGKCCAECIFFRGGGCAIVNGDIDPMGICRYWIITDQALEEGEYDDGLREEDGEDGQDGESNGEAYGEADDETKSQDPYEEEVKAILTTAERNKLKDSDFVFPDERAFPIVDGSDVEDAVSSWGRYRGSESFETFKKRLIALARRKGLEDKLPAAWSDEKKSFDFAIKAVGKDVYRGLGVVFGGQDLTKDTFTKHTDLGLERSPENIPVFFEHGLDDSGIGTTELRKPIGRVIKADTDDIGVWFEFQLNKRSKYVERIRDLIDSGAVGLSTGALPHVVERENGQLKQWYIGELSITTHPAEPRTLIHTTPKVEAKADDESSESPRRPLVILLKK